MPSYRPIPDDRTDEFRRIRQYAFRPADPSEPGDAAPESPQLGSRRGLFDGDDLLCICTHRWFTTTARGAEHPLAGLSGVATPPENRRQGYVARLLRESLAEYRDRGYYLSALWPFEYAFYRRYGWVQAGPPRPTRATPTRSRLRPIRRAVDFADCIPTTSSG